MFLDDKNNIPLQGYKNIQYNEWKKVIVFNRI
jgi:hypothetical protein